MTTRRNDHIASLFAQKTVILALDDRCADRGFLRIVKAEFFQCAAYGFDACAFIVCDKRRSQTHHNRVAALNQYAHLFDAACNLLGVLRTDNKTVSAQDTFIPDDVRLIARKADGFDRTVTNALVTILTVGFFQHQTA